jgi:MOSC domain-containing protein YiiM
MENNRIAKKAEASARVVSINISEKKGTIKTPVDFAELIEDFGIKGDAHAGPGIRQVSLIAIESYKRFEKENNYKSCLKHGSFGENIITEGIVLHKLPMGTRLKIGNSVLQVSKIGKECHAPCGIAKLTGKCIMPDEGVFAVVLKCGIIKKDDIIKF